MKGQAVFDFNADVINPNKFALFCTLLRLDRLLRYNVIFKNYEFISNIGLLKQILKCILCEIVRNNIMKQLT